MSRSMVVAPVFVIAGVPARIEKVAAVPSPTVVVAAFARPAMAPIVMINATPNIAATIFEFFMTEGSLTRMRARVASISVG